MRRRPDGDTVRVAVAHRPSERAPIQIRPGDQVEVGARDDEWPAFVLITTPNGGSGWVPARFLSTTRGTAEVLHDYNTIELAAEPGAVLTVIERDDEGGWYWCRDANGDEGWIPVKTFASTI